LECKKIVEEYLDADDVSVKIPMKDMLMINECFSQIKIMYKVLEKKVANNIYSQNNEIVLNDNFNNDKVIELENVNKKLTSEIERLKDIIKRQDEEMKVLLGLVEKYKERNDKYNSSSMSITTNNTNNTLLSKLQDEENKKYLEIKNSIQGKELSFDNYNKLMEEQEKFNMSNIKQSSIKTDIDNNIINVPMSLLKDINTVNSYLIKEIKVSEELLSNDQLSFIEFKKYCTKSQLMQELLTNQKSKFNSGKELTEEVKKLKVVSIKLKEEVK
jgi:hypothetical protein